MATINGKSVEVRVINGTNGYSLANLSFHSPREVKEAIKKAQEAMKALLDITNGEGGEMMNEMSREVGDFYMGYLSKFVDDTKKPCGRMINGEWVNYEEDFSDVPFIRTYDDDDCVYPFYVEGINDGEYDRENTKSVEEVTNAMNSSKRIPRGVTLA